MQFDFKEKAKKRQDRNSPIKPLFCIQFENPSKVSWGEFQISMGFVQPPRSAPIFDSPHESLVTHYWRSMQKAEDLMRELEILLEENDTGQDAVHEEAFPEEEMDDISMIYKELSEEERILLSLKYEGRHTSKEIGAVIGISPSLVRMRLSRITEKLRKQMKKRNE